LLDEVADEQPGPERLAASVMLQTRLRQLSVLTEQERTAFTLRHYEDLPIAEICRVLDTSENAVKHAIFRAVRKIRKAVEHLEGEWAWRT
jgi:RNA polymerase sigma-70 factor (ECF subfamily)